MRRSENLMMTSISTANQAIRAMCPEKSSLNIHYHCDRLLSIEQKQLQQNTHNNHPKRRESLHTTNSNIASNNKKLDKIDNEEEVEDQQLKKVVDSLRPYDVICGRGSIPFNNIGNRRFRILISMNVRSYDECNGRNRKGLYIRSLVRAFEEDIGVRFFKLKNGKLIQLTPRQIRQKVGHALRDVLAFQESQLELEKQRKDQVQFKQRNSVTQTKKTEPWLKEPTTVIPHSKDALPSVRPSVDKERPESTFQNHALPCPIPPPHPSFYDSSTRFIRQDSSHPLGFHDRGGNPDIQQHPSSLQSAMILLPKPNCFPVSATMQEQQQHQLASAVPRQNKIIERDNPRFQRRGDNSLTLHDYVSKQRLRNDEKIQDKSDNYKDFFDDNINKRCNDERFDDDDFAPLPIDHPEQGDDIIDMF